MGARHNQFFRPILTKPVDLPKAEPQCERAILALLEAIVPSAEIDIDDQRGDGRFIEIDEVEVGLGQSWLVIFNESGDIVASALVSPSVEPVSVLIISRLTNSQTLTAYLYLDDGDGVFDRFDDPLIRESPEKSLQEEFDYRVRD